MRDAALRNRRCSRSATSVSTARSTTPQYDGILKRGLLGDVYHARLAWHRNGNWRRQGQPPSPDYDPSRGAIRRSSTSSTGGSTGSTRRVSSRSSAATRSTSRTGSSAPRPRRCTRRAASTGSRTGARVADHVYGTFEYPGGRTAVFSSIESNAFDDYYEMFLGTKGTLILRREQEALLFEEGPAQAPDRPSRSRRTPGGPPVVEIDRDAAGQSGAAIRGVGGGAGQQLRAPHLDAPRDSNGSPRRCASGTPLACGPDKAIDFGARLHPRDRLHGTARASRRMKAADSSLRVRAPPHEAAVRLRTLRDAIMRCELAPGDAARHRRSRAPLPGQHHPGARSAAAAAVGRARRQRAHVGATVAPISQESVHEVFTILEGLEVVATRAAAERATRRPTSRPLRACRRRWIGRSPPDRPQRWADLNTRFHLTIGRIAGMPMLEDMLRRALDHWDRLRRHYFRGVLVRRMPQAQAEHHEILAQMRGARPGRARADDPRAQPGARCAVHRLSRASADGRRGALSERERRRVSVRVAALKTADAFARHLAAAGIDLAFDASCCRRRASPLARPVRRSAASRIGNRFCILPMEGWDGTTDGEPSDLTRRRWRHFGLSGAKLIWGGEAVAVRPDGRANPHQLMLTPRPSRRSAALRDELVAAHASASAPTPTTTLRRPAADALRPLRAAARRNRAGADRRLRASRARPRFPERRRSSFRTTISTGWSTTSSRAAQLACDARLPVRRHQALPRLSRARAARARGRGRAATAARLENRTRFLRDHRRRHPRRRAAASASACGCRRSTRCRIARAPDGRRRARGRRRRLSSTRSACWTTTDRSTRALADARELAAAARARSASAGSASPPAVRTTARTCSGRRCSRRATATSRPRIRCAAWRGRSQRRRASRREFPDMVLRRLRLQLPAGVAAARRRRTPCGTG